jgi:hypothetical protein
MYVISYAFILFLITEYIFGISERRLSQRGRNRLEESRKQNQEE